MQPEPYVDYINSLPVDRQVTARFSLDFIIRWKNGIWADLRKVIEDAYNIYPDNKCQEMQDDFNIVLSHRVIDNITEDEARKIIRLYFWLSDEVEWPE